ncbi:uncharacterized protein PGTG_09702 [Puccinia graminis f. sp. tritici CRL 75-36-700-3]|uniref:Cytochrome P450-dit2 n=1 Tax=Puccinia graminis f. sp. tritici (strain CRL 75-36-700-3 / race SCCL) TaxID=418459 RepID=E3KI64_PUCGT|nr:uncharacterized protein PGTG_09702 [Puccinia graminis f. sp. tritici CRL 75-36-700-3]EFP83989.2 hypothetical protein PGTG_09702 [Puccinia graminis f. sp. tritici CRL 75-36-700-3]
MALGIVRLFQVSGLSMSVNRSGLSIYKKGPLSRALAYDVLGDSIFVSDGPVWKRARHATSTIFTMKTFKTTIVPCANQSIDRLVKVLKSTAEVNQSIDFCNLFYCYTLESFVQMTFGTDLGLLGIEYNDEEKARSPSKLSQTTIPFAKAFEFAQDQLDFRIAMVMGWQMMERLNASMGNRMKASCCVLDEYVYSLIDERMAKMAQISEFEDKESSHSDLLSVFMNARDERGGGLGRTELRDTTLSLIVAGRDTTAHTLSWAFFHVLMNKDLVSKIREEAIEILGDQDSDQDRVTYENYKQFIWSQAVVYEALRLHPSIPKSGRYVASDDRIPGGPTVEAGNLVRWSAWKMGRDASLWGPDCGEFKPDRWIDETGRIKKFGPFKFPAFGGGPRICIGQNLAMLQAVKVIVEVFKQFDLEFAPGWLENVPKSEAIEGVASRYPTPMYRPSLTLPMAHPMMVSVHRRTSSAEAISP